MSLFKSFLKHLIVTPEHIGNQGEKIIANKLSWVRFCGKRGKLLQNIYLPNSNGETSEVDLLYITSKGAFVIESKNYAGFIFGDEHSKNWTATLDAGKDFLSRKRVNYYHFYNPIWQNNTHIKCLRQYLNMDIQTFSIIVFSERCTLKNISCFSPNVFICQSNSLSHVINEIWNSYPDLYDDAQIKNLFYALFPLANQDRTVKEKHIVDIQSKLNQREVCPWCGAPLILRTSKKGSAPGHQFLGCCNYPQCKYTQNL